MWGLYNSMNIHIMDQEKSEQISQFGGTEIQINEVISQQDAIEGRKKKEVNVGGGVGNAGKEDVQVVRVKAKKML